MNIRSFFVLLLLLSATALRAQTDHVVLHFTDGNKGAALRNVTIIGAQGVLAHTDSAGYAVLPLQQFGSSGTLVAVCPGYKTDTLTPNRVVVVMYPLSGTLHDVVVTSSRVHRLLPFPNEYVADYSFAGDNIIAATYSGSNGRNAKLFLLGMDGTVTGRCELAHEPVSLFKSCAGIDYCVCTDHFYSLAIEPKYISLKQPYTLNLLRGLQECEQTVQGNRYYRIGNRAEFSMAYGVIPKGDSTFKLIERFEEKEVAENSFRDYLLIMELLAGGDWHSAYLKKLSREKWDKGSYAHISLPFFSTGDSLVIFDYFKRCIRFYDLQGQPLGAVPIAFEWKESQLFSIVKDEPRNKFYIHRYGNQGHQTVEELNLNTGATAGPQVAIERPFAEQVKVYNGDIYFLWQHGATSATRQLFVQRTYSDESLTNR